MNKSVVVIDDKTHALTQIEASFPQEKSTEFSFHHFKSFREFAASDIEKPGLVFLDFFLDNDRQPGPEFVRQIKTDYLIGFSSMLQCSQAIFEEATKLPEYNSDNTFYLQKHKDREYSQELNILLKKLTAKFD